MRNAFVQLWCTLKTKVTQLIDFRTDYRAALIKVKQSPYLIFVLFGTPLHHLGL